MKAQVLIFRTDTQARLSAEMQALLNALAEFIDPPMKYAQRGATAGNTVQNDFTRQIQDLVLAVKRGQELIRKPIGEFLTTVTGSDGREIMAGIEKCLGVEQ